MLNTGVPRRKTSSQWILEPSPAPGPGSDNLGYGTLWTDSSDGSLHYTDTLGSDIKLGEGGGGGPTNPFDQDLNTTDDVVFNSIHVPTTDTSQNYATVTTGGFFTYEHGTQDRESSLDAQSLDMRTYTDFSGSTQQSRSLLTSTSLTLRDQFQTAGSELTYGRLVLAPAGGSGASAELVIDDQSNRIVYGPDDIVRQTGGGFSGGSLLTNYHIFWDNTTSFPNLYDGQVFTNGGGVGDRFSITAAYPPTYQLTTDSSRNYINNTMSGGSITVNTDGSYHFHFNCSCYTANEGTFTLWTFALYNITDGSPTFTWTQWISPNTTLGSVAFEGLLPLVAGKQYQIEAYNSQGSFARFYISSWSLGIRWVTE